VAIASGGRDTITAIEARERERTGIGSLKVKYNSVFGLLHRGHARAARARRDPGRVRAQADGGHAERFVTPELAEYESKIFSADERRVALELEIFERSGRVAAEAARLPIWRGASHRRCAGGAGRGGPPRRLFAARSSTTRA